MLGARGSAFRPWSGNEVLPNYDAAVMAEVDLPVGCLIKGVAPAHLTFRFPGPAPEVLQVGEAKTIEKSM